MAKWIVVTGDPTQRRLRWHLGQMREDLTVGRQVVGWGSDSERVGAQGIAPRLKNWNAVRGQDPETRARGPGNPCEVGILSEGDVQAPMEPILQAPRSRVRGRPERSDVGC
jgi:hypothetical protein